MAIKPLVCYFRFGQNNILSATAMMTSPLSSSSSSSSLHRFHRKPPSVSSPPLSLLSVFSSSSSSSSSAAALTASPPLTPSVAPGPPSRKAAFKHLRISPASISRHSLLTSSSSSHSLFAAFHQTPCLRGTVGREGAFLDESDEEDEIDEEGYDELDEEEVVDGDDVGGAGEVVGGDGVLMRLSVKEKKELASYANSLGKKLKCQLVGKSGVTESVGRSFVETLEANELLKIKIHRTCPGELEDVVKRLEILTGSVVVGQIGRTVIIYRPSITKMKAEEEKKKQARRIFTRRQPKSRFTPLTSKPVTRPIERGRRGSSRARV